MRVEIKKKTWPRKIGDPTWEKNKDLSKGVDKRTEGSKTDVPKKKERKTEGRKGGREERRKEGEREGAKQKGNI